MNILLYACYVCFLSALFLSSDILLPQSIFVYLVIPLSILPIEINIYKSINIPSVRISWSLNNPAETFRYTNSSIFYLLCLFLFFLVSSTGMQPTLSFEWFLIISNYALTIIIFVLITARILNGCSAYKFAVLLFLVCVAGINSVINLKLYFDGLSIVSNFSHYRFYPHFGIVPDHFPTTAAITYSVVLVICYIIYSESMSVVASALILSSAIANFICLLLTQSRASSLVIVVATIISFRKLFSKSLIISFIISIALIGCLLFISPKSSGGFFERLDSNRLQIWRRFYNLIIERPILGYGERITFEVTLANGEILGHAHNIFLDALLRGGVGAFISLILIFIGCAIVGFLRANIYDDTKYLLLFIVILIPSIFDFDLIVFMADWQWITFWLPIAFFISVEKHAIKRICSNKILQI